MMRELFARWATRATWATAPDNARDYSGSPGRAGVAQQSEASATWATDTPGATNRVAHVAQRVEARATCPPVEKPKQHNDVPDVLPVLPTEFYTPEARELYEERLSVCLESGVDRHRAEVIAQREADRFDGWAKRLDEVFREIAQTYEAGALPWALDTVPGFALRFRETEDRFDELACLGATQAKWRVALAAYAELWAEAVRRFRSRVSGND